MIFNRPVSEYMTREVEAIELATPLPQVARLLERCNISAVPVMDPEGEVVGVVSRSDLLRLGRVGAARVRSELALRVPEARAADVMTRGVHVVAPHTPLTRAAALMCRAHVHRLFVVKDGRLVGVLSTADVATAVRDARVDAEVRTIMSTPIVTVATTDPLAVAIARLDTAHVTGLIVVEDDWPVGVFTQVEALAARDLPADTRVDDVFDQAMICLPATARIHRVAAQVAQLAVRRVIVCADREPIGIVSGLDLARVAAGDDHLAGRPSPNG